MQSSKLLIPLALSGLLATPVLAGEKTGGTIDPYAKPDDSWISISGTVVNPKDDTFMLDYGQGTILVEMDDWDGVGEAYALIDGDRVTVYGAVDDGLFDERQSKQAASMSKVSTPISTPAVPTRRETPIPHISGVCRTRWSPTGRPYAEP